MHLRRKTVRAMIRPSNGPCAPLRGAVLPTVLAVSVVMLMALLGLMALWEQEYLLFVRTQRLRQARADIESAATLYRLHPDDERLTAAQGYLLCDTLPQSRVFLRREPWGLYELLHIATADSLAAGCLLTGAEPDAGRTLCYAGGRAAVTLAGRTELRGMLYLPQNGLSYGRMGSDFFRGREVPRTAIHRAASRLPAAAAVVAARIDSLFAAGAHLPQTPIPDSLAVSFRTGGTVCLRIAGDAAIADCALQGRIVLYGDELRIDSTCRMKHLVVVARRITVASGARIAAQLFARDTVVVEPRAVLEYPSGIRSGGYAELGEHVRVNGYVVVCDTVLRSGPQPCYRQARTARLRGLLRAEGAAQVQGIVAGCAMLRRAVYSAPQGYYEDMLYDCTLIENPVTAQPLGLGAGTRRRKEVAWVE